MSTIDDLASDAEHRLLEAALGEQAQRGSRRELEPRGTCHNCDATVSEGRLFCDAECGWAWEERKAARRRNGG